MHEMAIAVELQRQVEHAAAQHGAAQVDGVSVEIGTLRLVVPEALEMAWRACIEGTSLEGAALDMIEVAPEARCRACSARFAPRIDDYACPRCGAADPEILAGNDIILKTIDARVGDTLPREGKQP